MIYYLYGISEVDHAQCQSKEKAGGSCTLLKRKNEHRRGGVDGVADQANTRGAGSPGHNLKTLFESLPVHAGCRLVGVAHEAHLKSVCHTAVEGKGKVNCTRGGTGMVDGGEGESKWYKRHEHGRCRMEACAPGEMSACKAGCISKRSTKPGAGAKLVYKSSFGSFEGVCGGKHRSPAISSKHTLAGPLVAGKLAALHATKAA
eukprot:scaffold290081_cov17-Tisochrysis_lutea.AAC.1